MKNKIWLFCKVLFILLIIISFSPYILKEGSVNPTLLGMPKVLWNGIFISIGFIILTIVGATVINSNSKK